jgi:hypothetical protein
MRTFGSLLLASFITVAAPARANDTLDVNGHSIAIDAQTQIIVDGDVLPPGSTVPQKTGMRVEARFDSLRGVGAAATTVVFSYAERGPVTSIEPLRVLGQEVTVTSDTGMTGVPGGAIGNIVAGNHLDVSGYVDTNSSLLASFIEFLAVPTPRWLLSGYVTAINGNEAMLGPQRVSLVGVSPIDCGASLSVGRFVEIRADAIANFGANSLLDSVTRLTCVTPVPLGTQGALGALTGLVGTLLSPMTFQFGPYVVAYDAQTEFRFGSADDLVVGASIEVDGTFGVNGAFAAQGIQFSAPTIRLEGPVVPADVQPGGDGTVTVLANTVRRAAQLRDEDAIYANGITQARQVELRGYLDHLGNRWATRARLRGGPDATDSRAAGPVESVARPLLTVLGLTFDATTATFEDPTANPIDANTFFAAALPGAIVEQSGAWDGAGTLSGGVLALITPLDPPPQVNGIAALTLVVGTLRGSDALFANGFDSSP